MGLRTPCAGLRPGAADPTAQQSCAPRHRAKNESNKAANQQADTMQKAIKNPTNKWSKIVVKMFQNRGLEGCCAALGGLLGHLGVGGESGEVS